MQTSNPIPWHLIGELFSQGHSIDELSKRFNLPSKAIQRRLDVALASSGHIRSNAEISLCSNQVKADLVAVLIRMSRQLNDAGDVRDDKDLLRLERLTNVAQKLFLWPAAKSVDVTLQTHQPQNSAINLDLI